MPSKIKVGFYLLAQRTLAVTLATLASLLGKEVVAADIIKDRDNFLDATFNAEQPKQVKAKLVLKLNSTGDSRLVAQHVSHSSHRSHSSHSSHRSHSSHYSSSPSTSPASTPYKAPSTVPYTPPSTAPYKAPGNTVPATTPKIYSEPKTTYKPSANTPSSQPVTKTSLGVFPRELYKGCKGEDVTKLQKRLVELGYDTLTTGYFGDKTEAAVKKFQTNNELEPTGKVDRQTWNALGN